MLYVVESPSANFPHVVESVHGADSWIWGDPLLQGNDCTEYLLEKYAWIRAISTRDLEHAPSGGCHTLRASHNPAVPVSHWGTGWPRTTLSRQALVQQVPQMAPPLRHPPLYPSRLATPYQQPVQLQSKTSGLGVTFDSSASKSASTEGQDTQACERQATQGCGDGRVPASCSQEV